MINGNLLIQALKGGRGSGDRRHPGRPGKVGGSGTSGTGKRPKKKDKKTLSGKELDKRISEFSDATGTDYDKNKLWNDYKSWNNTISGKKKQAIIDYSGTDFSEDANNHLRGKKKTSGLESRIKDLDDAIDSAPTLKDDTVLYRAADGAALAKLKPGDKFTDKGFGSTTTDEDMADGWPVGDVQMKILAPKGSKGTYMAAMSDWPGEAEFLLPRNTKYELLEIRGERGSFDKQYILQIIE